LVELDIVGKTRPYKIYQFVGGGEFIEIVFWVRYCW